MEPRIDARRFAQDASNAMYALEKYIGECGLDHKLIHLLKLRASQINGCAYCIDMHSKDARALGETEQRLYELDAWRETPFYSDRERAALAWIEAVTLVSQTHVPDAVFEEVRKQFSEKEIVDLTYLTATINAWNRLAIALRAVPGHYRPAATNAATAS
ncbi:MAG TPA: carboxymuconolactone decarboxylase family protein [Terriglobales bacterium]|nr:carboxymuconolactone decarboxylase family protein [Terriglobales bacterium]